MGAGALQNRSRNRAAASAAKSANAAEKSRVREGESGRNAFLDYMRGLGPEQRSSSEDQSQWGSNVSDTTQDSQTDTDETVNPFLTEEYAPLATQMRTMLSDRLSSGGLPAGYEQSGIRAINASADQAAAGLRNMAAQRGVSADVLKLGSPGERARLGAIADFRTQTPLKARELQNQDIALAQAQAEAFGKGSRRKGTSRTSGSSRTVGSSQGGGRSRSRSTGPAPYIPMAAFMPTTAGPRATGQTGESALGSALDSAGGALGMMYGAGAFDKKPSGQPLGQALAQQSSPFATAPISTGFGSFGSQAGRWGPG